MAHATDARVLFHYATTVVTPAMTTPRSVPAPATSTRSRMRTAFLDGGETNTPTVPANAPAKNFWAVDIYDTQTRSLLQSAPAPALSSLSEGLRAEDVGSHVWFAPTAPEGKSPLPPQATHGDPSPRLDGSLEPWFDMTWLVPQVIRTTE